jgi:hypothetical protein
MPNLWIVLGNGATRTFLFRTVWRPSHDRQMTQLVIVAMAVGVGLVVAMLAWRARRLQRDDPEARYRKDIQALKRRNRTESTRVYSDDIWSAGAVPDSPYSKSKKAAAWVALGAVGGCGGCGGCGCGG